MNGWKYIIHFVFYSTGSVHGRTNLLYDYHNHVHAEGDPVDGADDAHFWGSRSNQILDKIAENMEVKI